MTPLILVAALALGTTHVESLPNAPAPNIINAHAVAFSVVADHRSHHSAAAINFDGFLKAPVIRTLTLQRHRKVLTVLSMFDPSDSLGNLAGALVPVKKGHK